MPGEITLNAQGLTLEEIQRVALDESVKVTLDPALLPAIRQSRQIVEDILSSGQTVYGINTGFGALSSITIPPQDVEQLQLNLVRSHAAGTGPALDIPTVRAMMLLRANTLAKGFSGVRPELIEQLLSLLNAGVHPVIPCQGSLGASGDLAPLAHLSLVLLGEGEAWVDDQRLPGKEALAAKGLSPITLKAKEGLALLNGTQMMTAIGTLAVLEAERLLDLADLAGAMTIEAIKGSGAPFDERIARVRPHPGHQKSASVIRSLLAESEILESHRDCAKVQDPYSLRCIPQVHGAARDAVANARQVLTVEANSVTDNPLVFPAEGDRPAQIISQGNFHGEPVALALDAMTMGLAEIGSISERRLDKLMNPVFSELPAFLVGDDHPGLSSGFMIVHYTAASLVSENKILAHPACVDSIPTSNDKEDHVSMGSTAARKLLKVLEHTRWILAAEILAAVQGLEHRGNLKPGKGVMAAYERIRQDIPSLTRDRSLAQDVERVVSLMRGDALSRIIETHRSE